MRYLKTNTATIVTVGPFFDKTDGVTLETALTITNERISFVVDANDGSAPTLVLDNVTGATSGTSNDLNYITNCDAGLMQLELSAANTNYLGRAFLTVTDAANHCPVFHEFTILPAMVYDSLIAGTDVLQSDMTQILGTAVSTPATAGVLDVNLKNIANAAVSTTTAQLGVNVVQLSGDAAAADNAESFFDGTGYAGTGNVIPTVTTVTTVNGLAANVITATSIAADAITAAKIANGAIDNATFAADVGSTAYATNIIALAADKAINNYGALKPTIAGRTLDVTPSGGIQSVVSVDEVANAIVSSMAAGSIEAVSFATGAITAAAIAADAIGASELATDAVAEIADAVWDELLSGHLALGSTGKQLEAVGSVLSDTAQLKSEIGTKGAALSQIPWNAAWDAEVQSELQDAIEVNHLDHLFAADYDPASKPGVATALLNELIESDGGVSRYTANALEQAPSGGGGGTTDWTADERTALRAILGIPASGTTPDAPSAGALKVIDDFLDTEVAAIKAKTDNLPIDPADQSAVEAAITAALADYGALKPTTAGRTLDVTATGAAGIDWGNVENQDAEVELITTLINGVTNVDLGADFITAASISTDAIAEIQSGLATAASIAALNNLSAAQVNAEVVDALNTDTYAEPGQGAPGATVSLAAKIGYLYKAWRNRKTQTPTTFTLYADNASTADQKATTSDDGTTFEQGEMGTGA